MKRFLLALAAIVAVAAGATVVVTEGPTTIVLYRGTSIIQREFASLEDCKAAVPVDAEAQQADANYRCVITHPLVADFSTLMPWIDATKIPSPAPGFATERVGNTTEQPGPVWDGSGNFRTVCSFSHMAPDDPIVYPGQRGRSHMHTFFGNTGVTGDSTPESIRTSGNSTCRGGLANRSSYWVPTLVDTRTGTPLTPRDSHFYYKTGYRVTASAVQPFPEGLRMIAGNSGATGPNSVAKYMCHNSPDTTWKDHIPNCPVGSQLWQGVVFPQCWNGSDLDSPDHKSHMAYGNNGQCPSSHPVVLPEITFNIVYAVTEADAPLHWRLSSDNYPSTQPAGYSSHGDWVNGWKPDISSAWTTHCLRAVVDCKSHLVGDGRTLY